METVLILPSSDSEQLTAECQFQRRSLELCRRILFFKGNPLSSGESTPSIECGGYCDLRSDGSVVEAFITTKTVKNAVSERYAFFPCAFTRNINVPLADGSSATFEVSGFHYIEKNKHETMCAQAALYGVVQYWQQKAGLFKEVKTTIDINEQSGVSQDDAMLASNSGRGLSLDEIRIFFERNKVPYWIDNYVYLTQNAIKRECVLQDIYGFVESGMPVIAGIKTDSGMHAITIIGHTFDKNSWRAMADVGYSYLAKDKQPCFLPNVIWVENLIVVDDNFGPYHFFPSRDIESMIAALFVPVPVENIIRPHEAMQMVVTHALFSKKFIESIRLLLAKKGTHLLPENEQWIDIFLKHLEVNCGDGLVLRPILRKAIQISGVYKDHEFESTLHTVFQSMGSDSYFWVVEFSWPDVFCFRQSRCGSMIFGASDSSLAFLVFHLPGILLIKSGEDFVWKIAEKEDAPHPHVKPG